MKATLVVGAFLAAVLIALPLFALATVTPISGTSVGMDHDPGGVIVSQTKTNKAGVAVFPNVKPGKYRLTVVPATFSEGAGPAVIKINIPGQATLIIRYLFGLRGIPFTVTGNMVQTVSVTITQGTK